jgi:hypothetical protein
LIEKKDEMIKSLQLEIEGMSIKADCSSAATNSVTDNGVHSREHAENPIQAGKDSTNQNCFPQHASNLAVTGLAGPSLIDVMFLSRYFLDIMRKRPRLFDWEKSANLNASLPSVINDQCSYSLTTVPAPQQTKPLTKISESENDLKGKCCLCHAKSFGMMVSLKFRLQFLRSLCYAFQLNCAGHCGRQVHSGCPPKFGFNSSNCRGI